LYITTTTTTKLSSSRQHHCKISLTYVSWPENPLQTQKSRRYFLQRPSIAHFASNFVAMATGVVREKMWLAAFNGPSPKTLLQTQKSRRYLVHRPSYSQFCSKFRCHGNGGRWGKMRLASFNGPSPKPPCRRKNLADISYTNRVI